MEIAFVRMGPWAGLGAVLLAGCATVEPIAPPTELPEVRPGYVAGYLKPEQLPNTVALLPPPPAAGSAALAADEEMYRGTRKLKDTPRWALAARDAELRFPQATEVFQCALGIAISAQDTPHLNMLLRRVRMDASRANDKPKEHYKRARPYRVAKEPSCTPQEEATQKPDSFPSGHASIGWAWALTLAEAVPEKTDVDSGRVVGAATVARLHTDPVFTAQLALARKEIQAAWAAGSKPKVDCDAEAKALALDR